MSRRLALALVALVVPAWAHAQEVAFTETARLHAAEEGGELAAEGQLVLEREVVRVELDRQHATTTRTQTYHNATEGRLEGRYALVAGEGAQVLGFAYWNGTTKIVGEVYEKETARQVYEEVTGLGQDPGLLEQVGEGAFTFRVFPIEPGEHKRIEVRTARLVRRIGTTYEVRLPVARGADVELALTEDRTVREIRSPSHALAITRTGARTRIVPKAIAKDGELVVQVVIDEAPWTIGATVHRDARRGGSDGSAGRGGEAPLRGGSDGSGRGGEAPLFDAYVLLQLAVPDGAARPTVAAKDVTLVIDRSGSMSGAPLDRAIAAAIQVVRRLRAGDRVNVVAFDDGVQRLYPTPRAADPATLKEAEAYLAALRPGGGTNIAAALGQALGAQLADDHPDVILFFTDGQSDARAALEVARKDPGDARVFTIGLGDGVTKPLLARLAAMKRGRFTFIDSPDAIEARVAHLFEQIEAPVLLDVALASEGLALDHVYPRTLPDLAVGDELVIVARVRGEGPMKVTIKGRAGDRVVSHTIDVTVPKEARRPHVGRLWAQGRTDELLEDVALLGETDELKEEILALALAYDLVTPYTSFLAIPEEEITDGVRDTIASARDRKRKIKEAHADAVALSRDEMPPGDPLLEVRAPADARSVTAHFPFGLVKDLTFDAQADAWRVRFLVPKDVTDGRYEATVVIVRADGSIEVARARYTIDSSAPDFLVETFAAPGGVMVRVTSQGRAGQVTVADVADPRRRLDLVGDADGLVFQGFLALPAGAVELRVVVADRARNEADQRVHALADAAE